jgi:hypothetical protein
MFNSTIKSYRKVDAKPGVRAGMGPVLGPVNGGDLKIPKNLNALDVSVRKL